MSVRRAALITGAARRLGRAIALHLGSNGWDIGVHYRASEEDAGALADELRVAGVRCELYREDLHEPAAAPRLVNAFLRDFPDATLLVNNASTFEYDTIATLSPELWDRQMTINALVPVLLSKCFHDAANGPGCIVNLLDQKVDNISPDFFSYTMSKLALRDATRMLAIAFSPKTRVNGVAPGLVLRSGDQTDSDYEREHDSTPLGVGPTAAEVSAAVAFIADTPSMTGQVLAIDGGRHMVGTRKFSHLSGD